MPKLTSVLVSTCILVGSEGSLMPPLVQCYIEGSGEVWEAACTDFDIYVTGGSLEETRTLLASAIETYVNDALREEEPARSQLLSRRSPWYVRLTWRLRVAISGIGKSSGGPKFEGRFTLPCPA